MKLPRSITVGAHVYRVRTGSKARKRLSRRDASGLAHHSRLRIDIHQRCADTVQAETLLHEVLHAAWDQTPLRSFDSDVEESVVAGLSPILFSVLRDNPDLLDMIRTA